MKKHELIILLLLLIISTVYSFALPETEVKQIKSDPKIKIVIEGKYNQTLTFDQAPTIEAVFKQLNVENIYGFDGKNCTYDKDSFLYP